MNEEPEGRIILRLQQNDGMRIFLRLIENFDMLIRESETKQLVSPCDYDLTYISELKSLRGNLVDLMDRYERSIQARNS